MWNEIKRAEIVFFQFNELNKNETKINRYSLRFIKSAHAVDWCAYCICIFVHWPFIEMPANVIMFFISTVAHGFWSAVAPNALENCPEIMWKPIASILLRDCYNRTKPNTEQQLACALNFISIFNLCTFSSLSLSLSFRCTSHTQSFYLMLIELVHERTHVPVPVDFIPITLCLCVCVYNTFWCTFYNHSKTWRQIEIEVDKERWNSIHEHELCHKNASWKIERASERQRKKNNNNKNDEILMPQHRHRHINSITTI